MTPMMEQYFEIKNLELCNRKVTISVKNGDCYKIKINDQEVNISKGEKYTFVFN